MSFVFFFSLSCLGVGMGGETLFWLGDLDEMGWDRTGVWINFWIDLVFGLKIGLLFGVVWGLVSFRLWM